MAKTMADEKPAGPAQRVLGRAGVQGRHPRDARRARQDQGSGRAPGRGREAAQDADRRVREGPPEHALHGAGVLRHRDVHPDREPRDPRRPPGLRAGALGRRLRRRGRQLALAAPHRRLVVLRAYVGKDGNPADYSPDNVPFHPKAHLQVTTAGLKPGDFVMVTGYPGQTARTRTAADIHHEVEWTLPYRIAFAEERYKIAEAPPHRRRRDRHQGHGDEAVHPERPGEGPRRARRADQGRPARPEGRARQEDQGLGGAGRPRQLQAGDREARAARRRAAPHRARRLRPPQRVRGLAAARHRAAADPLGRGARQEERGPQARLPGPRPQAGARRARSSSAGSTIARWIARCSGSALVRALQLPEADRPWLATLLDARKGAQDRRGADRQDARRLVRRAAARGREAAARAAADRHDRAAQGVEGPVPPGRAADLADRQGRGEEGRRPRPASCCWSRRRTSRR